MIYVATQVVNGTNHMIICKQTRVTKDNEVAIVKVVLNEKAIDAVKSRFSVVSVEPLYESDGLMGGWTVQGTDVDDDLKNKIGDLTDDMTGATYKPLMVAASQVVSGVNYKVLAKQTLILASPVEHLVELTVYVDTAGKASILGIKNLV